MHFFDKFCILTFWCFLTFSIFKTIAKDMHEPNYKKIMYGGVWKQVTPQPSMQYDDVIQASKHAVPYITKRHPGEPSQNFTIRCLSKMDLWYSKSEKSPLTVTMMVTDINGNKHPVSVPVTFGKTYTFQVIFSGNESTMFHFITLTKTPDSDVFYVYSHTFHNADWLHLNQMSHGCLNSTSDRQSKLHVLSTLAKHREMWFPSADECVLLKTDLNSPTGEIHSSLNKDVSHDDNSKETLNVKTSISVMSYNIWNFNTYHQKSEEYPQRLSSIIKLLHKAKPDIIGFQEIRFENHLGESLGPSQMDHLVFKMPEYQFVFQPAQMHGNSLEQGRTEEGVAIFSKFPIIHHEYLLLFRNHSNSADKNQRVCLHAVIEVPYFGKLHIFNTHFSLSHEAREESVAQILQYMKRYEDEPAIFMGDLNATPEEKAIRMLTDKTGLVDVWDILHPSDDGFTFSSLEKPSKRIDYIFMKKTNMLKAEEIKILPDERGPNAASDHRALMASFKLATD
ncbi:uncharacterized protein LOC131956157 [Physella acuta]|uniref:uncharacterized protein LOC131956157 n=1 Tax=Physella acuta TaxID=109671 RepID=UPI0027DE9675|nr:uncharacterized protein LOC131956157 [Physella acuta]